MTAREQAADVDTATDFIRSLVSAWECCATCAGGVLLRHDRAIKAKALREAADDYNPAGEMQARGWVQGWLIDRADDIDPGPREEALRALVPKDGYTDGDF